MTQHYFDPKREADPHALPDCEVFYYSPNIAWTANETMYDDEGDPRPAGWYWWACFPGCMPDSDPFGPFETEAEAFADARDFAALGEDQLGAAISED